MCAAPNPQMASTSSGPASRTIGSATVLTAPLPSANRPTCGRRRRPAGGASAPADAPPPLLDRRVRRRQLVGQLLVDGVDALDLTQGVEGVRGRGAGDDAEGAEHLLDLQAAGAEVVDDAVHALPVPAGDGHAHVRHGGTLVPSP